MDNIYAQKKVVGGELTIPQNYGVKGPKTGPPVFETVKAGDFFGERKTGEPGWYNWTTDLMIPELIDITCVHGPADLERIPMSGGSPSGRKEPDHPEQALGARSPS
jgi:hypothetical protein